MVEVTVDIIPGQRKCEGLSKNWCFVTNVPIWELQAVLR